MAFGLQESKSQRGGEEDEGSNNDRMLNAPSPYSRGSHRLCGRVRGSTSEGKRRSTGKVDGNMEKRVNHSRLGRKEYRIRRTLVVNLWSLILRQNLRVLIKVVLDHIDERVVRLLTHTGILNDYGAELDERFCDLRSESVSRRRGWRRTCGERGRGNVDGPCEPQDALHESQASVGRRPDQR